MNTYSSKTNARRAARHQLGDGAIEGQHFELIEMDHEYAFQPLVREADGGADMTVAVERAKSEDETVVIEDEVKNEEPSIRNRSSVSNPVAQVWMIADSMRGASRKEIIGACVEQGIAFFTARTQYQKWKNSQQSVAPVQPS